MNTYEFTVRIFADSAQLADDALADALGDARLSHERELVTRTLRTRDERY